MRLSKIPAAFKSICIKGRGLLTVEYECYHCKKQVRGNKEEHKCDNCGRLSCQRCLVECGKCGLKICYDCHVMCRKCYLVTCPACAPKCRECNRPICLNCSIKCDKCQGRFCSSCVLKAATKLSYICQGMFGYETLCDSCYQAFSEIEDAFLAEADIMVLSDVTILRREAYSDNCEFNSDNREADSRSPVTLCTYLFEKKSEALKSLRVTASYLNLNAVAGVRYRKYRVYNGNYVYYLWGAEGIAFARREAQTCSG